MRSGTPNHKIVSGYNFMAEDYGRRDFLKTSAAAALALPALQTARAATEKVNIGWIGLGTRGAHVLKQMYKGNA
ncbi:MAG: twin-arginine translocation signal domain-containing protein, partial [Acidobacteriota bacterium]|nr:twin-arginine translocation signal domain-containing protein [Acidobacteriota bacterium]